MSMGLANTHEAMNLASLAVHSSASLDTRNLVGKTRVNFLCGHICKHCSVAMRGLHLPSQLGKDLDA